MTIHRISGICASLALALSLTACPDGDGAVPDTFVGVDAIADTTTDVGQETTAETVDDTSPDVAPETGSETVDDVVPDTDPETTAETVDDVVPDTDPETTAETVDDVVPDTDPETTAETVDDVVDDTVPDTVDDTVPDTVDDTVPDTVDDTVPDTVDDTVPDTVDDTVPDTVADTTEDAETDAGTTSVADQIAAARTAAADGTTTGLWTVDGAGVTFTKAELGSDLAGFFAQAGPTGPAIFVQLVEGSQPAVGDDVTFEITELTMNQGRPEAVAITGLAVNSSGNDYTGWAQDVTNVDLSAELADYGAEVVTLTGTFVSEFGFAGSSFDGADLVTDGDASGDIVLRMPATEADLLVADAGGSVAGCTVTFTGPVWAFNTTPQPSVWSASEVTMTCPAIAVVSAASIAATSVVVSFSQEVDAASVLGDGSQFTFDGGLTAVSATVDGQSVIVELSTDVLGGTEYTVTVDSTVLSAFDGQGVDVAANTATFSGVTIASHLVISEVDYDQTSTDTEEFVEIYNPTDLPVTIDNYEIRLINGNGAVTYQTVVMSGTLAPGAFAVIASQDFLDTLDNGALEFAFSGADNQLQNGPDGVQLVDADGAVIDSMSYEGDISGTTEGLSAGSDTPTDSLQRCPAGADNDNNATDFFVLPPTAGADCN